MTDTYRLDLIEPNPWQSRQSNDPAGIEELALSIARDGLMQIPVGRPIPVPPPSGEGSIFQLAIGHRRLEAFRLLASIQCGLEDGNKLELIEWVHAHAAVKAGRDFNVMPLEVQDLTDQQMFEMAISENIRRKDLNPVELAAAMKRYMDEFHATSRQAGEFFGVNDATVRGTVRLLDLPATVQEKLAAGEMTVGMARKLLTVQRVAGEEAVTKVTEELSEPNADVESVINHQLKASTGGIEMWGTWRDQEAPLAGAGLWPLATSKENFPNDLLPALGETEAAKALGQEFTAELRAKLKVWLSELNYEPERAQKLIADGAPENDIERLAHLVVPPACTACMFYARVDKAHYCAFATCHKRKIKAWCQAELQRLSKELAIPIYDPQEHGKETYTLKKEWNDNGKFENIFDAHTDICLQAKYNSSQSMYGSKYDFTDSYTVQAILVGKAAHKLIEQRRKANSPSEQGKKYAEESRQRDIEWANRRRSDDFIKKVAAPIFAPAFAGMDSVEPLLALLGRDRGDKEFEKAGKGKKLELLRQKMAERALSNTIDFPIEKKGPLATAKYLQGVAITWEVKLPENWLELAWPFLDGLTEYEGLDGKTVVVSAETET